MPSVIISVGVRVLLAASVIGAAVLGISSQMDSYPAEHSCEVAPFSKKIKQGESVSYTVILHPSTAANSFLLRTGGLPLSVESGFSNTGTSFGTTSKKTTLVLKAGENAQTGSFDITVVYAEDTGTGTKDSLCQLNLVIEKAGTTSSVSSAPLGKSSDALTSAPTGLFAEVTSGSPSLATTSVLYKKRVTTTSVLSTVRFGLTESLSLGSRGAQVELLQEILQTLKFFPPTVAPTGYFGPITQKAVMEFQASKGIESIGIVGPKTRKALNELSQ